MKKDVQIQKIKQVIEQQRDADLQWLYREAIEEGISPQLIMRLWYGRAALEKQGKKTIEALAGALGIDENCMEHTDGGEEGGRVLVCDEEMLVEVLENCTGENEMTIGIALAVLAWVGFDRQEALDIRDGDVDAARNTIRGRRIPARLWDVLRSYLFYRRFIPGPYTVNSIDQLSAILEKPFIQQWSEKKKRTCRVSDGMFAQVMAQYDMTYQDFRLSGQCCRLRELEEQRDLTNGDICHVFEIDTSRHSRAVQESIDDCLELYRSYLELFYGDDED